MGALPTTKAKPERTPIWIILGLAMAGAMKPGSESFSADIGIAVAPAHSLLSQFSAQMGTEYKNAFIGVILCLSCTHVLDALIATMAP